MTFGAAPSSFALFFCLVALLVVPLLPAGLGIMNAGLGRTRSAAHFMLASLSTVALAACVYAVVGFSWEGFAGAPTHTFFAGGRPWDWLAREPLFLRGLRGAGVAADAAAILQVFAVGITALIPLAAGADRWRLKASLLSTAVLAGWIYPLFAHWVWGGGWLNRLGDTFGLGAGFLDSGGASTIHVVGGLSALSITWILGPRFGKYGENGTPAAIPGYNIVYVLFGCGVMLPGWIALNAAAALLFTGSPQFPISLAPISLASVPLIALNTVLSASAGCLAAMAITGIRFTKPDASLCANGWVGGLVTSSALCAFVTPGVAIFTGLVAGAIVAIAVELTEVRLGVDDPGGAISAHGLAGIWGLLAVGLFAHLPQVLGATVSRGGQLLAQLVGVATLTGVVLPMTYCLNWVLNRFCPQRVDRQGELLGMDLRELGGGAYPEFVIRTDEYMRS